MRQVCPCPPGYGRAAVTTASRRFRHYCSHAVGRGWRRSRAGCGHLLPQELPQALALPARVAGHAASWAAGRICVLIRSAVAVAGLRWLPAACSRGRCAQEALPGGRVIGCKGRVTDWENSEGLLC